VEPGEIAAAIGVELIGRLPHGEGTGAYEVRGADGTGAVLKLFTGDVFDLGASTELTDALHARGYPVPVIYAAGVLDGIRYEIQERMPGQPLEQATSRSIGSILELIHLQRDVGLPGRGPWLDHMVTSVANGLTGYCEHAAMTAHSDETRTMLERLRRIADAASGVAVREADVVHYDFSPYNVLVVGDRVTGVVDWDGATSGDAAFDLVTLAAFTYDYGVRDELLDAAATSTDPRALSLYAAHMVLRQVDWSLRNHGDAEVEWFMGIGADLLAAVDAG
jgi:Ser/Thr protein kinase RdoA (MazF antagonist)